MDYQSRADSTICVVHETNNQVSHVIHDITPISKKPISSSLDAHLCINGSTLDIPVLGYFSRQASPRRSLYRQHQSYEIKAIRVIR